MIAQRAAKAGLILTVGLLLAACSATGPSLLKSGHHFAVVDNPEQVTAAALIRGTLDVDSNGCWILRNGDQSRVMIWPSGTTLFRTKIHFPGPGKALGIGTSIQGSGGGGSPSKAEFPPCIAKDDVVTYIADVDVTN